MMDREQWDDEQAEAYLERLEARDENEAYRVAHQDEDR